MRHLNPRPLLITLVLVVVLLGVLGQAGPALAVSYSVDTTSDASLTACTGVAADCSLRGAITNANASVGVTDVINFNIPPSGTKLITLSGTGYPVIIGGVTIDGTTQPGYNAGAPTPMIEIRGTGLPASIDGLVISTATPSTIKGIAITGFPDDGVTLLSGAGHSLTGNYIGLQLDGTTTNANGGDGIQNAIGSGSHTIGGDTAAERNVVSANAFVGVKMSDHYTVTGNFIGTDATGTLDRGNGTVGVLANDMNNTVGGAGALGNVISGNGTHGITLATDGNVVKGNLVGAPATGIAALPNSGAGIAILTGADSNTIGGSGIGEGNTISGNSGSGVSIDGGTGTSIKGNQIGTIGGNGDLGNGSIGVFVGAATDTTIGGAAVGERNYISGNSSDGVRVGTGAAGTIIKGNYIGLGFDGSTAVANGGEGIDVGAASATVIGGGAAGEGNVVSSNGADGVQLASTTTGSTIAGNIIGLDATGTLDRGNADNGILLFTSSSNIIGGNTAGHRNLISGHNNPSFAGIRIEANSNSNAIQGNYIGTDITGAISIQNTDGVQVADSNSALIGGPDAGAGNVISGNLDDGVQISGASNSTKVQGNYIGVDAAGTGDLGNGANGIQQFGLATLSEIGGEVPSKRNVISGNNGTAGILMSSTNNVITGNYIGLNAIGATAIGNNTGVLIQGNGNALGGDKDGHRNVISGNLSHGVLISSTGNTVLTNIIGLDAGGTLDRGNGVDGINLTGSDNFIGGTATPGDGNTISGNNGNGVQIANAVAGVVIRANKIGTDVSGTLDRGNSLNGVFLNGADSNTIGGINTVDRNIISGNSSDGIELNADANSNIIKENYIGTDVNGVIDLGNSAIGVNIISSDSNIVGAAGQGNVMSGNSQDGVEISTASLSNTVQANIIGLKADSVSALGNGTNGIQMGGSVNNNTVGGDLNTLANHIAFNVGDGIVLSSGTGNLLARNSIHDNVALGIDLVNDGIVTPNDLDDPDVGANNLQNFPALTSASSISGSTSIGGSLNSVPSTIFALRFFYSNSCDGSGNGEGGTYLGGANVTTNAGGDVSFSLNYAGVAVPSLKWVTATATAPGNNTSEFSNCVQVPALTVDTTSDANLTACTAAAADCSLRGAMADANAASDADVIHFAIASGAQTIAPLSGLPTITAPVAIDGTTQPGFAGLPLVTIDGVGAGAVVGFNLAVGPSVIKGLVINRFDGQGIILQGNGTVIAGNYIGTNAAGVADLGNTQYGVYIGAGSDNVIGGTTPAERNLISGNNQGGVLVNGAENHVTGNYIGTDVTGTLALGNLRGIFVAGPDQFIGSATAGGGNLISANTLDGIGVGILGAGTEIRGNLIGTNATGTGSLANSGSGIEIDEADFVQIGAPAAAARNVISGNGSDGVTIGTAANNNRVWGNYIGTNAAGTSSLGNGGDGVNISAASTGNTIGDGTAGGRNVISGNLADGVDIIGGGSTGNSVLGNYIGSDVTGALDLGNGNDGVNIDGAVGNAIGGNVISGNGDDGVDMFEGSSNTITNNRIGTVASGNGPLGNGNSGINLVASPGNQIGGPGSGDANTIAHNAFAGVRVAGGLSTGNRIDRNSIHSNGGLGIDLAGSVGVTANDLNDVDSGPNNLQNFPVITLAGDDLDQALVHGFLNSTPSTNFSLRFYYAAACDGAGHGEGEQTVGSLDVTTGSSGNVAFGVTVSRSGGNFTGGFVTATATDPAGNTSEFSACKAAIADNDGDGDPDALDNCPAWSNPTQALPVWPVPANDPDCDGFNSAVEAFVGTDAADSCNTTNTGNDEALDAWPTDFNDSRLTSLADVVLMGPVYNLSTGTDPAKRRFDLNASGLVSLADVVLMGPFYNKGCS